MSEISGWARRRTSKINRTITYVRFGSRKTVIRCLGHYLQDDGGIKACFDHCSRAMWRCFFGNMSEGLLSSSAHAKMRFLTSSSCSLHAFRWPCWAYQRTSASKLDSIQRQMIAVLMSIKPLPRENAEDFILRRRIRSGRLASKDGRWSNGWASSLRSWSDHIQRKHEKGTRSQPLVAWHGPSWLQKQQLTNSKNPLSRKTAPR